MEIIQTNRGEFQLKNGPRVIHLTYEQVEWLLEDFYDLEYDIELAKKFYNITR